ncbi:flagellar hook-length control protein FliK [Enterobacter cloacae]|uniref:Flagellar hook-length control protein n=1 Tax=Enterobacter cloacae subsp. cloacae TaxID=336306 RepID=A0AAE2EGJ4_ENTCL|nr:flagellar hook-length control protein FliK [Enterobacter cloacae]EGQ5296524.1 flagellar hook-length control protein FliK [Enterobacter cloacae]EKX4007113.1 flagellar hook-length control protein FliK [Enterobacter cloacae]EKX4084562.1 flagellar hook-length control protein FliK [Enterobacter cloacae]ELE9041014.1 flagellar hook-length control protein FliK [Enterobacter cloacae]KJM41060.1 flagellar hook-length control protein [Enterobacter cloacae subsp. cloacae]
MNIDIAALLLGGGAQGKPKGGLLADDGFSLQLDDKLAELVQLFPGLDPQALAATPEAALAGLSADLLPQQLADDAPVTDADGMLLAAPPGLAEALNGVSLTNGEGEESPQWQLQQLVTRSVTGTETVNSAKGVANGKAPEPEGKTVSPLMTAADKTPAANATPLTAQSAPLTSETMVTPEMPAATSANAVALPAAVRTSVAHAPQQVVTVNHPPETPEWKQSVSQHIAIFSRNGLHSAEIRLHPEDLGSLQISLRVQQDQAQIHIVSEHAHIRHAMEQAMPQLRAAMAESGIQLGQANVSAEGQQFAAGEQGQNASGDEHGAQEGEEQSLEEEIVPTLLTTTPGNIYGINTFA